MESTEKKSSTPEDKMNRQSYAELSILHKRNPLLREKKNTKEPFAPT